MEQRLNIKMQREGHRKAKEIAEKKVRDSQLKSEKKLCG
jgi:hypothetical protein